MPRPIRNNSSRPSRNWGKVSGVTFTTHPSGVTITSATSGSVQTDSGYAIYHSSDRQMITSGILNYTGSSLTAQTLGLTTIKSVVVSSVSARAGSTVLIPIITSWGGAGADWSPSGVSEVNLNVYDPVGTLYASPCSIAYIAIGQ